MTLTTVFQVDPPLVELLNRSVEPVDSGLGREAPRPGIHREHQGREQVLLPSPLQEVGIAAVGIQNRECRHPTVVHGEVVLEAAAEHEVVVGTDPLVETDMTWSP